MVLQVQPTVSWNTSTVFYKRMHIKNYFPDLLKKAYVTPIYKKGYPMEAQNYRLISVTPNFAKVFETLLLQQMLER